VPPRVGTDGQDAGLLTACTEPEYHRRRESTYVAHWINYVERGNPVPLPDARSGRHYREACCQSDGLKNLEEAKALL